MEKIFGASWKTTVGGLLAAMGGVLAAVQDDATLKLIGALLSAAGMFLVGASARDNKVSSEDAGAK